MSLVFTVVVLAFVVSVLALVGYVLFALSPFAGHRPESFRDPVTGRRRWKSPRLD